MGAGAGWREAAKAGSQRRMILSGARAGCEETPTVRATVAEALRLGKAYHRDHFTERFALCFWQDKISWPMQRKRKKERKNLLLIAEIVTQGSNCLMHNGFSCPCAVRDAK